jgi:phosphatidylserine/phosphatidylglycerophosphate/cardiolipin synthase-like enzyme
MTALKRRVWIAAAAALLAALLAGCDVPITTSPDQPTLTPGGPTVTVPMPGGIQTNTPGGDGGTGNGGTGDGGDTGENDTWAVYFTDPVIPFDDVTTGGLDDNLVWLIDHAQSTIDAAVFEFDLQDVADALIAAHDRGVQVRLVYDSEFAEESDKVDQLEAAGIPGVGDDRGDYQHNKFFVFDGDIVWTGSMNITENGVYRNNNNVVAFVSPELAANYTTEFEEMFNGQFGASSPANTPNPGVQVGDMWVENYFSPDDDVESQLISVLSEAQQSIHFMAFSFTLDSLGDVMMAKSDQGVEVAGLFEARGANSPYSECPRLLDYGIDVRLDGNPRVMHHKVMIVDGQTVVTGSFNFSANAAEDNDENVVIIHSPAVAAYYEAEFARLVAQGSFPVGGECLVGE